MTVYYNEINRYAAQWLRNLITAGHIADGVVDERSIEDVHPSDLDGFTQCHFFAGVGVWSYALRHAGWPDDRPVWTGSCPCQPFSSAGQGSGFDDERHLWPHFHWLIGERRPAVILGEQVASKDADPWIDLVCTDLEALGYAFGAVPFPSASVGAPHIRDRSYWVADLHGAGRRSRGERCPPLGHGSAAEPDRRPDGVGDHHHQGLSARKRASMVGARWRQERGAAQQPSGALGGVGNTDLDGAGRISGSVCDSVDKFDGEHGANDVDASGAVGGSGPTNGFWGSADWLLCRDGKWRPVEPGTFPLAHGATSRVGRLRAYGNAINAVQAIEFIKVVSEVIS